MGANEEVTSNLGTIGLQSVGITVFAIAGSMSAVTLMRKILKLDRRGIPIGKSETSNEAAIEPAIKPAIEPAAAETCADDAKNDGGAKTTLLILGFVAAGMLAGYFAVPKLFADTAVFQEISGNWLVAGICILLGLVGFDLGLDGSVFKNLATVGVKVIFIPMAAIAGSMVFGAVYSIVSPLGIRETVAISAGFGWYTLAPGIIAEAGFAVASAVSFMHNVIRETVGIVIIPLIAKKIGYLEATAVPGVAAMDICMPIVERCCRPETVVYSFCTGVLMSVAVPLFVQIAIG